MGTASENKKDVMVVFHKREPNGSISPIGIPKLDILQIAVSRQDGATLLITSNGKIAVADGFEDAIAIYNKAEG